MKPKHKQQKKKQINWTSQIKNIFGSKNAIKRVQRRDLPGGPMAKTPSAGDLGSISGWETRSHMPQLRAGTAI